MLNRREAVRSALATGLSALMSSRASIALADEPDVILPFANGERPLVTYPGKRPLNGNEITVKFWEVSGGSQRFVAGDEQYTRERGSRIFSASITVAKPEFETNKQYLMTVESGSHVLAQTKFWLRGKGPTYSGKVEFTDEETKRR